MFSLMVIVDGRPVHGESSKARSDSFSGPLGDGAVGRSIIFAGTIQLLSDLSYIEAFPGEKLDDRSILDIRRFLDVKTNSS